MDPGVVFNPRRQPPPTRPSRGPWPAAARSRSRGPRPTRRRPMGPPAPRSRHQARGARSGASRGPGAPLPPPGRGSRTRRPAMGGLRPRPRHATSRPTFATVQPPAVPPRAAAAAAARADAPGRAGRARDRRARAAAAGSAGASAATTGAVDGSASGVASGRPSTPRPSNGRMANAPPRCVSTATGVPTRPSPITARRRAVSVAIVSGRGCARARSDGWTMRPATGSNVTVSASMPAGGGCDSRSSTISVRSTRGSRIGIGRLRRRT